MASDSGTYNLPKDGYKLLTFYDKLYQTTGGTVTPLIGNTLSDAGYDASYSFSSTTLHPPPEWPEVISYDHASITISQPVLLDFGAAGKGYLVDILGELLEGQGIDTYCINAGGDIRHRSPSGHIRVGLEHPDDPTLAVGECKIQNLSICGSAGNRRKWQQYMHIINPYTLRSPSHLKTVWVSSDNTMLADGLATALYFCAPDTLKKTYNFEYALVHNNNASERSADFPGTFFS
jgi:FAD:protein FMN transferase